jgi:uncharacterized protein DUF1566
MIGCLARFAPRFSWPLLVLLILLIVVRGVHAASSCPGDLNNNGTVTIDEIVRTVDAALHGCPSGSSQSLLLQTGQTQCDQGTGILGACPGSPPGQDGAVLAGEPRNYTDNGDGTIQDNATGLTWEKLSNDGGIHDWTDMYTWHDAFAVKIAALNKPPCFAGHCDWRLPNRRELESLVDAGRAAPAIDSIFNTACEPGCAATACSCTQLDYYWSSTSYQDPTLAGFAWNVDFNVGFVRAFEKTLPVYFVRAVRSGS